MSSKCVTYVPAHLLPMSPVYTPFAKGEDHKEPLPFVKGGWGDFAFCFGLVVSTVIVTASKSPSVPLCKGGGLVGAFGGRGVNPSTF